MISRHNQVIPPRGSTQLLAGDHLFIVLRPETRAFVDAVFSQTLEVPSETVLSQELRLKGTTRVSDVRHSYGIQLGADGEASLDDIVRPGLPGAPLPHACLDI